MKASAKVRSFWLLTKCFGKKKQWRYVFSWFCYRFGYKILFLFRFLATLPLFAMFADCDESFKITLLSNHIIMLYCLWYFEMLVLRACSASLYIIRCVFALLWNTKTDRISFMIVKNGFCGCFFVCFVVVVFWFCL